MRNLSLNLAAILSLLGMVMCLTVGVVITANGDPLLGLSMFFLGSPFCLALAVVFDYVAETLRRERVEGKFRSRADVIDTPWEDDPDHT